MTTGMRGASPLSALRFRGELRKYQKTVLAQAETDSQSALFFKRLLLFEPGVVVTSVPVHLADVGAHANVRG